MTTQQQTPMCTRHKDRTTWLSCSRCDRPWCHECLTQGSVGAQCPECIRAADGPASEKFKREARTILRGPMLVTRSVVGIMLAIQVYALTQGGDVMRDNPLALDYALRGPDVREGEYWRLITAAFLHYGIVHIAFNCWVLWQLGRTLERPLGRARYLALFLASCLGGSFGALLLSPNSLSAGASGGAFGLMGAAVALQRMQGVRLTSTAWGSTLLLNLIITASIPGISIGGHLGGLVVGWIGATLIYGRRFRIRSLSDEASDVVAISVLGIIAVVGSLAVANQTKGLSIKQEEQLQNESVDPSLFPPDASTETPSEAAQVISSLEALNRPLTEKEKSFVAQLMASGRLGAEERNRAAALLAR